MPLISFGGLASGIDFNQIIDQMMAIERQPITLMEQRKERLEFEREAWNEVNTKLLSLKTSLEPLFDPEKIRAMMTSSSDEASVTATADPGAAIASYDITVSQLATATSYASGSGALGLGIGGKVNLYQPVTTKEANFGTLISEGTFSINGVSIEVDSDDYLGDGTGTDGNDLIKKINDALAAAGQSNIVASYNSSTDKLELTDSLNSGIQLGSSGDTSNFLSATGLLTATFTGGKKVSTVHLGRINPNRTLAYANFATALSADADGLGKISINGVEIGYDINTDSLNDLLSRINSSDAGVSAAYDSLTDRVVLTSKTTGSLSISREDVTGNLMEVLDLTTNATESLGSNAEFTVSGVNNGNPIIRTSNHINDVVSGVTFDLKAETTSPVTISVSKDLDTAKAAIEDFVTKYNEIVDYINDKLTEKRDFEATTDFGRKQGILSGNSVLVRMKSELANLVIDTVPGLSESTDALFKIGISRDGSNFGKSGHLVIDDAKLTEALEQRPEEVANLFFKDLDGDNKPDEGEEGIAARIDNYLSYLTDTSLDSVNGISFTAGVIPRQQDSISDRIEDIDEQIEKFEARLEVRRTGLVAQFTAMETALATMQNQSSWLSGQIANL